MDSLFNCAQFIKKNAMKILLVSFFTEFVLAFVTVIFKLILFNKDVIKNPSITLDSAALTSIIVFTFLLFITMFLIVILTIWGKRLRKNRDFLLYLTFFIILSAIWIFFANKTPMLYLIKNDIVELISTFAFYLMPIPFLFFAQNVCHYGKSVFHILSAAFIAFFAVNYVLFACNNFLPLDTSAAFHIIIIIPILLCLFIFGIELFKYKNKNVSELFFGSLVYSIASFAEFFVYYFFNESYNKYFISFGIVAFILLLAAGALKNIAADIIAAKDFAAIASSIPSGIFLAKNDDILTIIYANDFFYKIYGYSSPKEAIDDNFTYANKTVVENLDESTEYRKAIIEKKSICFELETRENDRYGNEMWLLTRFEYLPQTDELAGAVINITERKHIKEQLSINEEEYRVLTRHTTNKIGRYDILRRQFLLPEDYAKRYALPTSICGLPQSIIKTGLIAVKSISTYESFFNDINSGKPDGSVVVQLNEIDGTTTWWNISFDTIFSDSGVPQRAVIIYDDITVLREKETAYEKWKQEILSMSKEKTAIFEWNLSQDVCEGESGEQLVHFENINRFDFNGRTNAYSQYIHRSERIAYKTILNRERLIAAFDEGVASYELEFREIIDDDSFKWMFLDVKLVPYPNSKDIKAYIIMRDIDSEKKERIDVQRRAREDALTGLLNRATFEDETKNLLNCAQNGIQIAFLMIDIDGFKKVNDTMGHTVGDEVLIDLAKQLKTIKHREYIVGRLGGDEFAICINNIPKSEDFKSHAQAICELLRKNIDKNLTVSASVGIAIFPDDGQNFDELYRKSDIALYEAKKCGRNRYKFYENSMENTAYIANATQIN